MTQVRQSDVGGSWMVETFTGRVWEPYGADSSGWTMRGARKAAVAVREMAVADGYAADSVRVRARNTRTGRTVPL